MTSRTSNPSFYSGCGVLFELDTISSFSLRTE